MRPAASYWSNKASACLARMGLVWYGREVASALSGGTEKLNGIEEQKPKPVFGCGKDVGELEKDVVQGGDGCRRLGGIV